MSFLLLTSHCRGTILICNFCQRGKQTRALSLSAPARKKKKQINFSLHFPPSIRGNGQLPPGTMWQFIGVDVSCQSISEGRGIDGRDDEEILMHIYQLIKGQRRHGFTFPAFLRRSCLPLKNPPSHAKG